MYYVIPGHPGIKFPDSRFPGIKKPGWKCKPYLAASSGPISYRSHLGRGAVSSTAPPGPAARHGELCPWEDSSEFSLQLVAFGGSLWSDSPDGTCQWGPAARVTGEVAPTTGSALCELHPQTRLLFHIRNDLFGQACHPASHIIQQASHLLNEDPWCTLHVETEHLHFEDRGSGRWRMQWVRGAIRRRFSTGPDWHRPSHCCGL